MHKQYSPIMHIIAFILFFSSDDILIKDSKIQRQNEKIP